MEYKTELFFGGMWNISPEADRTWYQGCLDKTEQGQAEVTIDDDNPRFGMLRFRFTLDSPTQEDADTAARDLFEWATSVP